MEETDLAAPEEPVPVGFEIERRDDYGRYLIRARAEVVAILRLLVQRKSLISAYFNDRRSFLLTAILEVDSQAGELIIDCSRDANINRQALLADRLTMTTTLDKVKVQFVLGRLDETQSGGLPAFKAAIPAEMLRLQRREHYRLTTPISRPVKLQTTIRRPDGSALAADATLLDISGGGIGLMATPLLAGLIARGAVLGNCKVTLPEEGLLVADLGVRNRIEMTTRGGARYVRLGCQFIGLPGIRMNMVQRYIARVERERKARLSGLA
ncbi:flagellar brake protein [Accumulibacter sp.]|uniref:flagellar brake protein n=1 Tax=Accumulibacter sp. TaxID=2053492 RepID=UPI0025EABEEF|nr:flagellar brake protein [Accumulibacter sp.]MCM8596744.1 flagellar brake protein [Accumulibacter sp.]MCM8624722.1 flagellar brake protein [Accumulibacter sp.]MDS4050893.1 flagellar brake protein [Accumulibacter sp.]